MAPGDVVSIPVDSSTTTAIVEQVGAIIVALITLAGIVGGAWFHGRRTGEKRALTSPDDKAAADIHRHLTDGFKAQMDAAREHYEALLARYEALHAARSQRIEELTLEVHELREEVHHLQQILTARGIPIPPRSALKEA